MQFLRKLLISISGIILLVTSIIGLLLGFDIETNEWIRNIVSSNAEKIYTDITTRTIVLVVSAVFLLLCITVLFSVVKFRRREKTIRLKSPYGEVRVSLGAIEDFIKMIKDQIKGVKEIRTKVFVRSVGLKIYVKVSLWSDSNIHEMAQDLQNTIRRYIQDTLGIQEVAEIRVFVGKILFREKKEEDYEDKLRGIEYPSVS